MTTLHDRLADLADEAPRGGPAPGVWQAGVRRARRRRAAATLATAVLVAIIAGAATFGHLGIGPSPEPVTEPPRSALHLPLALYPPSPWARAASAAPGVLAAVGMTERDRAHGLRGVWQELAPYAISATDGSAFFLDLGGRDRSHLGGLALSPDGTKVGYARYGPNGRAAGLAVYDSTTATTTLLSDPRWRAGNALDATDLRFSTDSRYLETTMVDSRSAARWRHALVVWDVSSGAPVVAEPAGHYWLPNLGSGPDGIVWSRGPRTFTFDPVTRRTSRVRTPFDVVEASYGPDGRAFAAIAFGARKAAQWRLYVGPSAEHLRRARLPIDADQLIGWSDAHHVVVRQLPSGEVVEVDLRTGVATRVAVDLEGRQMMLPSYAADLWANPLVPGRRPARAHDPRLPWWIVGGTAIVAIGPAGLWWRRRRAGS
ncbi:hypothetical protein [Nocardioides ultimimeridianus]